MTEKWNGLVKTIQKFKSSVKEELDKSNEDFHLELNGETPLSIKGLGVREDEINEYFVDPSDVLFWHDPTAYIDELERWENQKVIDTYSEVKRFLNSSDQVSVFKRFVESIKRKRVSPFVGAGLSAPCGFPLWGEALEKMVKKLESVSISNQRAGQPPLEHIEEINGCIKSWRYLEAAQLLYENHKIYFESYVRNTFDGATPDNVGDVASLLPKLSDGCVITTNFDEVVEKAFIKEKKVIEGYMHGTQSQNQFASKLIQGERCILKLHGHFNSPDTYIFSKAQYEEAYGVGGIDYTKPLAKVLRQVFISHSLVFIGCSLAQDKTLELFSDVASSNEFDIPSHFAFLPDNQNDNIKFATEDYLGQAKIDPIWYSVTSDDNGLQDHSQLHELLSFAVDCAHGKASF
ncbi:SIR2 family protein [Halomonas sp. McH1-25]|uniref:SIR2 family protein n=1 Tax=unclassified Halomonas TaxID=2609666 RepID=UPI001EF6D30A|nr:MULTISPECIES: SIR2 family protein [unclassified Halomonas]MCG7601495.1 SIR2 family protein [Halomonas sp. McH1-25]MCP1344685.1 SIR2 family protein [Halomonas sp. FL8]MCP1363268.1 SIR2 family protein [Halomonas sp. BBD45]MCP1364713.1 SIR2 family protein [Halomonas sp. BBD48]